MGMIGGFIIGALIVIMIAVIWGLMAVNSAISRKEEEDAVREIMLKYRDKA